MRISKDFEREANIYELQKQEHKHFGSIIQIYFYYNCDCQKQSFLEMI